MAAKTVNEYINAHSQWEEEINKLREMILPTGLEETIKWGAPAYTYNGKNVVSIGAFKNHLALWFFQGALLKENTALLQNAQDGKTHAMRQIRFEKGDDIKPHVLKKYVLEALENQKEGKTIKPPAPKKVEIPAELKETLKEDEELRNAFKDLTPGKQREYAGHIAEAKRDATRQSRLKKIIPMIKEGKGLHDKYKNC